MFCRQTERECENIMYEELVSVGGGGRKSDNKTFYEMLFYTYTSWWFNYQWWWCNLRCQIFVEKIRMGNIIGFILWDAFMGVIEALHFPLNVSALIVIFSWSCNWDKFEIKFLILFSRWWEHSVIFFSIKNDNKKFIHPSLLFAFHSREHQNCNF